MKRYAYFDNAKLLLIFLVVFGHMIQPFTNDVPGVNTIYTWIYTFHMPTFIFLAGFFAKGSGNKAYILKLAKKLLIPYIIFQIIYTGYYFLIGKDDWLVDSIFYPHWSLWFLFSLFCWHMLLIFFKKLPSIVGILLAVQIGLLVGYFGHIGHSFSLSRTFVFFPYFLLGYWVSLRQLSWVKRRTVKITSLMIMVMVAIAIHFAPDINAGWLLASKSYSDLGLPEYGGFARFFIYLTSTMMMVSILAWVPRRKFKFTYLGERTLYVYLLHGFIIQYARQVDLFKVDHFIDLFGIAILSIGIVLILSSRPVQSISQPLIEGRMSILKKYVY